ncbi:ead/Ea22-like family protein [Escherichia coli]|nr:ead/Ea22-like family protein [Escherichia coli]ELN4296101.1 ead/Ea22-like family protein [Escherichia coli]
MSKIDYQKLREIAEKTKIAGEAPVMPFDQRINALNDFMKHFSPDIALALLDERERNQQYIKRRDQENEDIALTVGKLRVELEGKDKLIAELGKQCAEWERKALSNFEECAAMAERIEELEHANTRQDANINHQHEGMTQSVTRHIYHYNAVNGSDSMSGIAQLTFMIKSQSDLEELKSALSKVCGFHANAITSLSYLGCEEEANTKDANPNGGA